MVHKTEIVDWLPILQAVHAISPMVGGDTRAKEAIVHRLRDGAIRARAWWMAQGIDFGAPYIEPKISIDWDDRQPHQLSCINWSQLRKEGSRPRVSENEIGSGIAKVVHSDVMLGTAFWTTVSSDDLDRWNWGSGFCVGTWPSDKKWKATGTPVRFRQYALGVELDRKQVLEIVGEAQNRDKRAVTSKAGRPPSERTPAWVAELVLLHHSGDLETLSAKQIVQKIADSLGEKGLPILAESSAWKIANAALTALRQDRESSP